jgi:RHS repeat-associated protein
MVKPAAERKNRHHPPAKSASRGPKQRLGNFFSAAAKNGGENSQQSTVNAVGFAIIFEKSCDGHAYLERYRYDSYGKRTVLAANGTTELTAGSAWGNQIGFTGRYHDAETGLQYFRERYYDSTLGRFIGRDLFGYVNGWNLYQSYFVPNNVDPHGTFVLPAVRTVVSVIPHPVVRGGAEIVIASYIVGNLIGEGIADGIEDDSVEGGPVTPKDVEQALDKRKGKCTEQRYRELRNRTKPCSAGLKKCTTSMTCEEIRERIRQFRDCANARSQISSECFGGADHGHKTEADNLRGAAKNCEDILKEKKCCDEK